MELDKAAENRKFLPLVGVGHRPFDHILGGIKGFVFFGGVLGAFLIGMVEKFRRHPSG